LELRENVKNQSVIKTTSKQQQYWHRRGKWGAVWNQILKVWNQIAPDFRKCKNITTFTKNLARNFTK